MNFSEAVKKASELGIAFDHEEFGFIFFDADRTNCNVKGFDTLFGIGRNSYNIKQSIVSNVAGIENKDEYKYSYARVLFDETEGMNFDIAANREVFVEDVIKYIYGKVPTEAGTYDAIIATGYSTVVLDKPLTEHDMELSEKRFDDPDYGFSDEEVKNCADTDRDGLFDFEEVMFFTKKLGKHQLITYENNEIKLPSVDKVINNLDEIAYVQSGLFKARIQYKDCYDEFSSFSVLPIISDPTNPDGDGDSILDIGDHYPLIAEDYNVFSHDLYLNDNGEFECSECEIIIQSPDVQDKTILTEYDYLKVKSLKNEFLKQLSSKGKRELTLEEYEEYYSKSIFIYQIEIIRSQEQYAKQYDFKGPNGRYYSDFLESFDINNYMYEYDLNGNIEYIHYYGCNVVNYEDNKINFDYTYIVVPQIFYLSGLALSFAPEAFISILGSAAISSIPSIAFDDYIAPPIKPCHKKWSILSK